jgi:hypothetical protein
VVVCRRMLLDAERPAIVQVLTTDDLRATKSWITYGYCGMPRRRSGGNGGREVCCRLGRAASLRGLWMNASVMNNYTCCIDSIVGAMCQNWQRLSR